jgi:hypothetical protein
MQGRWKRPLKIVTVGVVTCLVLTAAFMFLLQRLVVGAFGPDEVQYYNYPASTMNLKHVDFEVGDVRYQILVPPDARIALPRGKTGKLHVQLPGTRMVKSFTLGPLSDVKGKNFDRSDVLSNGAVFRYDMDFGIGGGSGGPAANLIGRLDLGAHTLSVVCHDQAERGVQPHWCAPYLHHLKVADGS